MAEILIDATILICAYDRSAPQKQQRALQILDRLATAGTGAVSTHVLLAFGAAALDRLGNVLTPETIEERIARFSGIFTVLPVTLPVIRTGLRGVRDHQLEFWDAQIWATAWAYHIPLVLSETLQDGTVAEGVRFENPLRGL